MRANTTIATGTLLIGLVASFVTLFAAVPKPRQDFAVEFHVQLAAYTLMACLHVGAALLFALSLGVYKAKLRLAFAGIVVGILLIALGTIQLPILDILDLWESAYVAYGIIGLPFLASGLVMYFGAASFSRLVGHTGALTYKRLVIPSVVILSLASTLLPHVASTSPETTYDASNIILAWVLLLDLASALIALRLRAHVGTHYAAAVTWLSVAMFSSSTCVALSMAHTLLFTTDYDALSRILTLCTLVAGFAWLRAGYLFRATKEY